MREDCPAFQAGELAKRLGGELIGDPAVFIEGPGMPEQPDPHRIVYADGPESAALYADGRFAAVIAHVAPPGAISPVIVHPDPRAAFLACLEIHAKRQEAPEAGIRPGAFVDRGATLGDGVAVCEGASVASGARLGSGVLVACGARIGRDAVIGAGCRVGENVVIGERVILGERVTVHPGAVIGGHGFGFIRRGNGSWQAIPQLGTVRIGNDVEIGANTTIDRATAGETRIGDGCKIDNLVQIAHNVVVGRDVLIASQCGIAGSARIGDRCILAGQVGIADHCIVEDDVVVGAKSGVTTTRLLAGRQYFGSPAREAGEMKRMLAALRRLVRR